MAATNTWRDELASLVDDAGGIRYVGEPVGEKKPGIIGDYYYGQAAVPPGKTESWKEQVMEFLKSWGEMMLDLGKGCKDIVQQTLVTEDSFLVQQVGRPLVKITSRFEYLNDFLPEDRDPAHAWPIILFVFMLALAVLSVNTSHESLVPRAKRVRLHPPSADRVMLPDGRHLAYRDLGVPAARARFSVIAPHSFLSSRLAEGIPGVKTSLLEEFGIRLVTYDLPGFGESDPHPSRNLNSSAQDMLNLANAVGVNDKFWVLGYSSGSMHSWAALKYIPDRVAGAAIFAPMINPYEPTMTKEEMRGTWARWLPRRKLMYFLARKFPRFLSHFYRRSFLSGNHGRIDEWMSQPLGRKDEILIEEPIFEEFWHRDVEESIRQGSTKPFIEEAVLQVSSWGFNLADLQVQRMCKRKGILLWLMSIYSQEECDLVGYLGPIHIWQGTDDQLVPPSMTDYISRVLPGATLHSLPNEGHFSYFFFCDQCHRQIFSTLFGDPVGPLEETPEMDETPLQGEKEDVSANLGSAK